jgi:hypothetical protein
MPSLYVAWAAWCAVALVAATRGRWRHLAWLYPAATTFVVLATANHFLADAAGGLAVTARATTRPPIALQDQATTAHRDSHDQAGKGGSWGQRG